MQRVRAIVVGYLQAFWYGLLGSPPPQQAQAQAPGSGDANTGNARGMCMPCGPAGSMATEDLRGLLEVSRFESGRASGGEERYFDLLDEFSFLCKRNQRTIEGARTSLMQGLV